MSTRILVLGSGDVGSAVAHRLFLHGLDVVLADVPAPAHPRRGMAFTDAWYDGTATLEGVVALRVSDAHDLGRQLVMMDAIPCTAVPLDVLVKILRPDAVVDARMRKRALPEDMRALAPVVVGLGPGFSPGSNCTAAVETAWGGDLGLVLDVHPAAALSGEPRQLGGAGRERFVYAPQGGEWNTHCHIGDCVTAGDPIGTLMGSNGSATVLAPLSGSLRGLSHSGVMLRPLQKMVEVDPSTQSECYGLGARPSVIARGVSHALGLPCRIDSAFFGFEAPYIATLDCIPISMRFKLDRCGLKLSRGQWRSLPMVVRETLLEAPIGKSQNAERLSNFLHRQAQKLCWGQLPAVATDAARDVAATPSSVNARCAAEGQCSPSSMQWALLTPLQRYALVKLSGQGSGRNWNEALEEFGLAEVQR